MWARCCRRLLPAALPARLVPCRGRKCRTDPPARSKADRLRVPTPVDPAELLVVQDRYRHYVAVVAALRGEFKEALLRKRYEEEVGSLAEERARTEAEEHRRLMEFNQQENQRLQGLRDDRLRQEAELEADRSLQAAASRENKRAEFLSEKEREVLQLQEEVKSFITLENLEQRIEEALDSPQSYNFALDKEGRVAKQTVQQ
ncbi:28S ribosomal protein S26, mitochondrial [Amblyraja radiata]|uniref:28S ribosomal protein S26, mitochondrial n=1 Tax=Amblyraja radiata TaxID=386614 RepID=UPI0014040AD4|nr:28S ribosomal protein S26, mitochondrial [Amblyraja radiata]XP_032891837.1 28S ribosomal protein S26, mitochondrial [Amblyraja radiata]